MTEFIALENIQALITRKVRLPTVVMWNRLEGRPRRSDFDRALRAEIRDALWMVTKQWQAGEFRGDDAGSPVHARLQAQVSAIERYKARNGDPEPFRHDVPLEATVERRRIPFETSENELSLDLRLLMGRQWLKMVAPVGDFRADYITEYPIDAPDPTRREGAPVCAHVEVWQRLAALAGRAMDGAELYFHLKGAGTPRASDNIAGMTAAQQAAVDALGDDFVTWFEELFFQPDGPSDAWSPEQLEYGFALSAAPDARVLVAEEYYHDRVDWYNLDHNPEADALREEGEPVDPAILVNDISRAFFPTALQFDGQPHTRWWTFEDGKTNFGDVAPDTTDLGKLLLMEFGLVYANDWFLVPLTVPAGSVVEVRGLAVTNVFGERTWIAPAGAGPDDGWQAWRMFRLSTRGSSGAADTSLVMLPTLAQSLDGRPLEDVALVRDEVSNMVWAIESTVPLPDGTSKPGREAALEMRAHHERLLREAGAPPPPAVTFQAPVRYQIMTTVPENWIPFIPVHRDGDNREIQLQRASMPRIIEGDPNPPVKVKPRTTLLRQGLEEVPPQPYFVFEEEVPRSGVQVVQRFQRTRWYGGRTYTWLGVRKLTGRGEGASRLAFDELRPTGVE